MKGSLTHLMVMVLLLLSVATAAGQEKTRHNLGETDSIGRKALTVKTNMLYDLATALNLSVELPIGNSFSVEAEYINPWWIFNLKDSQYCLQGNAGQLELRWWPMASRNGNGRLSGFFAGVYGGAGRYDLQLKTRGWQSEGFWNAGIGAGYSFRINRRWSIEAEAGFGCFKTTYAYYIPRHDYEFLHYQYTQRLSAWAPTRARVALVYNIFAKDRRSAREK